MKKTALIMMIITVVSQLFGFGREIVLSYYYGASNLTDVYLIALTIPGTLFAFFLMAISTLYIPMYCRILSEEGEGQANRLTSNLLRIIMGVAALLVILVWAFTPQLVNIFAMGFEGETLRLAIQFTRVSVFGVFPSAALTILIAYLQIKSRFVISALAGFLVNFAIIVTILISHRTNEMVLIWGTLGAWLLQLLFILPWVYRSGYRPSMTFPYYDKNIKDMLMLALPVLLGTSVNQINTLVDRTISSSIVVGGVSVLNYATKLNGFVQAILVSSIAVVIFPSISRMASEGRMDALKSVVSKSLNFSLLLILPVTVGAMVFARPIVRMLFGNGAFDERAVVLTSNVLFFYSMGMAAFGVREVVSKAFYSLQDTKTPMYSATLSVVLNIVLNIVLSRFMGISGLALATSVSAIVCSGLLFWSLHKKIGMLGLKVMAKSTLKIMIASGLMGMVAYLAFERFKNFVGQNLSLLLAIFVGVIIYGLLILALKVPEVDEIIGQVKEKFISQQL